MVFAAATGYDVLTAAIITLPATLAACVGLLNLRVGRATHKEVRTMNGQTPGNLADRAEGRRIEAATDPEDRTASEQRYVKAVTEPTEGELAAGEDPPR